MMVPEWHESNTQYLYHTDAHSFIRLRCEGDGWHSIQVTEYGARETGGTASKSQSTVRGRQVALRM